MITTNIWKVNAVADDGKLKLTKIILRIKIFNKSYLNIEIVD